MRPLSSQERLAAQAVAKLFPAAREETGTRLIVSGRPAALEFATLRRKPGGAGPHLRFDKVATRLMDRLRAAVCESVPEGIAVWLAVTAPIRLPAKTAAALETAIRGLLARPELPSGREEQAAVCGNRVRLRLLPRPASCPAKLVGFVHNPDADPLPLFEITRDLMDLAGGNSQAAAPSPRRWLVLVSPAESSCLPAYRVVYPQLGFGSAFEKVLVAFADGRAAILRE